LDRPSEYGTKERENNREPNETARGRTPERADAPGERDEPQRSLEDLRKRINEKETRQDGQDDTPAREQPTGRRETTPGPEREEMRLEAETANDSRERPDACHPADENGGTQATKRENGPVSGEHDFEQGYRSPVEGGVEVSAAAVKGDSIAGGSEREAPGGAKELSMGHEEMPQTPDEGKKERAGREPTEDAKERSANGLPDWRGLGDDIRPSGEPKEKVQSVIEQERRAERARGDGHGGADVPSSFDEKALSPGASSGNAERRDEYVASFEAIALRRPEDHRTAFEISVESLEKQRGAVFEEGKVYSISGTIGDVCEFRKTYSPGESGRMAVFAPGRFADSIEHGGGYEINVRSVQEISRTSEHLGVFYEKGYSAPGDSGAMRFDVLLSTFEERTGIRFEDGKTYRIAGTIGGVTGFETTHSRSEGKYLYVNVPGEVAGTLERGRKHELKILSVEEWRTYAVQPMEGEVRLQLQKAALRSVGIDMDRLQGVSEQDRILELTMRNLSHEGEEPKRFFSQLNPTEGVILKLGRVGAVQGDRMELVSGRPYGMQDFLKDYGSHRGKETQNVALQLEGKKLGMEVDGRRHEINEYRLGVHALRIFLKAKTQGFKYDLHFIVDANEGTVTAKTARGRTITSFASTETRGLQVRYLPRKGDLGFEHTESRHISEGRWERSQFLDKVSLIGESGEIEGRHRFQPNDDLNEYMWNRIAASGGARGEIGGLGEDLGAALVTKLGMNELESHPFDKAGPGREWYKHGTDLLCRDPATGELLLFEFRWWRNIDSAVQRTRDEVRKRRDREGEHPKWGRISGAYIAVLHLEVRSNAGEFFVEKVW
jgi:hypothetical protein